MITTGNHPCSAVENQVNDCNYICEKNLLTLERWDAKSFVWCDKLQATKPVFLSFSLSVTSFFLFISGFTRPVPESADVCRWFEERSQVSRKTHRWSDKETQRRAKSTG